MYSRWSERYSRYSPAPAVPLTGGDGACYCHPGSSRPPPLRPREDSTHMCLLIVDRGDAYIFLLVVVWVSSWWWLVANDSLLLP